MELNYNWSPQKSARRLQSARFTERALCSLPGGVHTVRISPTTCTPSCLAVLTPQRHSRARHRCAAAPRREYILMGSFIEVPHCRRPGVLSVVWIRRPFLVSSQEECPLGLRHRSITEVWLASRTPEGQVDTDWCCSPIRLGKGFEESCSSQSPTRLYAWRYSISQARIEEKDGPEECEWSQMCELPLPVFDWLEKQSSSFVCLHVKDMWTPSSQCVTQGPLIIWETHWKIYVFNSKNNFWKASTRASVEVSRFREKFYS